MEGQVKKTTERSLKQLTLQSNLMGLDAYSRILEMEWMFECK